MDDEEYLQPVLVSQEEEHFQKLDTIPVVSVPLALGVSKYKHYHADDNDKHNADVKRNADDDDKPNVNCNIH